jgi:RNA polymerase sigma-70 factor (ECF subfamily)
MLSARTRRAEPVDPVALQQASFESAADGDPAERVLSDEAFRLALLVGLERLPARQRAVLTLRDVFGWKASEVAELLGVTVAAVNSMLQRARASLDPARPGTRDRAAITVAHSRRDLMASYLAALRSAQADLHRPMAVVSA